MQLPQSNRKYDTKHAIALSLRHSWHFSSWRESMSHSMHRQLMPSVSTLCSISKSESFAKWNCLCSGQVFGHLILFQELLLLIETILNSLPRVELILPVFDFIERVGCGYGGEWLVFVLQMCGRLFTQLMPHILNVTLPNTPALSDCFNRDGLCHFLHPGDCAGRRCHAWDKAWVLSH